jgi:hypothetical protein
MRFFIELTLIRKRLMPERLFEAWQAIHGCHERWRPLPVPFGGPLRLRVPRQLGYKSVKFVTRLMLTDSLKGFVAALDSKHPNYGYAWYGASESRCLFNRRSAQFS